MYDKGLKLRDRKPTNPGLIRTSPYGDWKEQGGGKGEGGGFQGNYKCSNYICEC
jgi:hypothetical protein